MTHTNHSGLKATWTQNIGSGHKIEVFIWEDSYSLEEAVWDEQQKQNRGPKNRAHGLCNAHWYWDDHGKHIAGKKFGELHFTYNAVDVGLIAHEIQHLMNSWIPFKRWDLIIDNERIAETTETLTRKFWREWQKHFV